MLHCNPKSPIRQDIIAAFKQFAAQHPDWEQDGLEDPKRWSNIYKGKTLPTFFGEEDHLQALKTYFLGLVAENGEFQAKYPGLPWMASAEETDDEQG